MRNYHLILTILCLTSAILPLVQAQGKTCQSQAGAEVSWTYDGSSNSTIIWNFTNPTSEERSVVLIRGATGTSSSSGVPAYAFGNAYFPAYAVDGLAEFYSKPTASDTKDSDTPLMLLEYLTSSSSTTYHKGVAFVFILKPGTTFTILEGGFDDIVPYCQTLLDVEYYDTKTVNIDYGFLSQCLEFGFICEPDPFNVTTAIYRPVNGSYLSQSDFWPSEGDTITIYGSSSSSSSNTSPTSTPTPTPVPSPSQTILATSTLGDFSYMQSLGSISKNVTYAFCPNGSVVTGIENYVETSRRLKAIRLLCSDGSVSGTIGVSSLNSLTKQEQKCPSPGIRSIGGKSHTMYSTNIPVRAVWDIQTFCSNGNYSSLTSHEQEFDTMQYTICPFGTVANGIKAEIYQSYDIIATITLECETLNATSSKKNNPTPTPVPSTPTATPVPSTPTPTPTATCVSILKETSSSKGQWTIGTAGTYGVETFGLGGASKTYAQVFCEENATVSGVESYIRSGHLVAFRLLCSDGSQTSLLGSQNTSGTTHSRFYCDSYGVWGLGGKSNQIWPGLLAENELWDIRVLCQSGNYSSLTSHTNEYDGPESYALCATNQVLQGVHVSQYSDDNYLGSVRGYCVAVNTSLATIKNSGLTMLKRTPVSTRTIRAHSRDVVDHYIQASISRQRGGI
ncbi:uncharacterized protein Gasu_35060 [Galdieria sulphuraria]|uniref:Uncharacterized protein n=1 Tax=Galdieria sulphuraria TaxID=130081 RepID=M2XGD8_GALSU|nr:uncharacterized protein Gasu_35060 [Galdieria sulphuraria]EME29117.1 hypothetical protein Gasu_35060 [Galdieria sulphuraria]|eukprot:XP_005705637.1 hypothetical protein Gasu_35060 [Galdieria sulphuraria]